MSFSKISIKKKRFSKKLKKNQRKIDISDVEKFIDQRIEDTLRGGPIEFKEDAQLFFVDTASTSGLFFSFSSLLLVK